MLLSMTGFGEATRQADGLRYRLEIRTVNNRYLKASIKLPEELAFLEARIEKLLRRHISRGTVHYSLRVGGAAAEAPATLHPQVVLGYLRQLDPIREELAARGVTLDLTSLLALPGACEITEPEAEDQEARWAVVEQLTDDALEKMRRMRAEEGKALHDDLAGYCRRIERLVAAVRERAPLIVEQYNQRLRQRTEALLAATDTKLDQDTLIREVAIFAERCDVAEELSRLASHLQQFRDVMDSGEHVGRTLEFIAQEMLREANTIGSKANDSDVARSIVEIKGEIDRIKEQVMNVE
jgi:uncharacterized protein (TIGR00255 family)